MNILAIGNSFSQDSTRYLHQIARKNKDKFTVVNLYIGACSLERHYRNMLSEEKAYSLELNGAPSGFFVSLKEALLSRKWDYISIQQVSSESIKYENFQPYLNELVAYIKKLSPKAKLCLHQIWAYEQGSKNLNVNLGYADQSDMFNDIKTSYDKAYEEIRPDVLFPSGEVMQEMLRSGMTVHRDGAHADSGRGRYALSLLWYGLLSGKDIENDSFCDLDKEETEECLNEVRRCVSTVIKRYR